jgi:hypothetical protein
MKKKKVQGTFLITSHMLTGTKEEKDWKKHKRKSKMNNKMYKPSDLDPSDIKFVFVSSVLFLFLLYFSSLKKKHKMLFFLAKLGENKRETAISFSFCFFLTFF